MNAMTKAILLATLSVSGCASIGPGQVGVLWKASGGTRQGTYGEGLHAVAAWNEMYVYDLRSMSRDEVLSVIAVNGLTIRLDASVRYHLLRDEVVPLHEEVGPKYYEKILEPVLRSEARRVFGQYTPEEIYSTKRDVIEREIRRGVITKIEGRHIALEAILIRDVQLPDAIRIAIDKKLAAEQEVLKMRYVLAVAKATAEQKQIDAQAIADSNRIIAASLNPAILEFERIQQMTQLATSSNSKTVLIGATAASPVMIASPGQAR
jgi:regulator of protease activity HflC (stomatin/prohibitin superfamily)